MIITWFGHSSFRLETKDGSIILDPFSKELGLKPPKIKDQIVLISHNHYDHNNIEGVNSQESFIIDGPGEYEKQGMAIRGIRSYHDKAEGKERGLNTIYVIKSEQMTICHLGDLGQAELTDEQVEEIGDIDILMIPVGGKSTIDFKEAVHVVGQIEPKVVIPMHYKLKDLKLDIDGKEKFVKEIGITAEKVDKFKISSKTLPTEEMKLITFEI